MTDNPMHLAETDSVSRASRCGARTRSGAPCKSAPVTGRRRCRMHGGADGSGAPKGPKNGNYKHGRYTKEVAATRRWIREAIELLRKNR
jgi:glucans biosynthesis protein